MPEGLQEQREQLRLRADIELGVAVPAVHLDGFRGDRQAFGHGLGGIAAQDQLLPDARLAGVDMRTVDGVLVPALGGERRLGALRESGWRG